MNKTSKTQLMNFVASFPALTQFSWTDLHEFLVIESLPHEETAEFVENPRKYRGRFNHGFATPSLSSLTRGAYLRPTEDDPRYLVRLVDGSYILHPSFAKAA